MLSLQTNEVCRNSLWSPVRVSTWTEKGQCPSYELRNTCVVGYDSTVNFWYEWNHCLTKWADWTVIRLLEQILYRKPASIAMQVTLVNNFLWIQSNECRQTHIQLFSFHVILWCCKSSLITSWWNLHLLCINFCTSWQGCFWNTKWNIYCIGPFVVSLHVTVTCFVNFSNVYRTL